MTTSGIIMWNLLGENKIDKFLSTAACEKSWFTRQSNQHSAKKNNFVTQFSGHRSLKNLTLAIRLRMNFNGECPLRWAARAQPAGQHLLLAQKPQLFPPLLAPSANTVESANFNPVQMGSGFFSGATIASFNKCTFNIHLTSGQLCTTESSGSCSKRPRIGESDGQMKWTALL